MGAGIAAATVRRDMGVTITDAIPKVLAGGVQKVLEEVAFNKATKGADPQRMLKYAALGERDRPVTSNSANATW